MLNEPVAWMSVGLDGRTVLANYEFETAIPLYTHPVNEHDMGISHAIGFDDGFKAAMKRAVEMNVVKEQDTDCQYCKQGCIRCDARKQLTDEEIIACIDEIEPDTADMIRFARAILLKAQE